MVRWYSGCGLYRSDPGYKYLIRFLECWLFGHPSLQRLLQPECPLRGRLFPSPGSHPSCSQPVATGWQIRGYKNQIPCSQVESTGKIGALVGWCQSSCRELSYLAFCLCSASFNLFFFLRAVSQKITYPRVSVLGFAFRESDLRQILAG